jgi:hypothetical protein
MVLNFCKICDPSHFDIVASSLGTKDNATLIAARVFTVAAYHQGFTVAGFMRVEVEITKSSSRRRSLGVENEMLEAGLHEKTTTALQSPHPKSDPSANRSSRKSPYILQLPCIIGNLSIRIQYALAYSSRLAVSHLSPKLS